MCVSESRASRACVSVRNTQRSCPPSARLQGPERRRRRRRVKGYVSGAGCTRAPPPLLTAAQRSVRTSAPPLLPTGRSRANHKPQPNSRRQPRVHTAMVRPQYRALLLHALLCATALRPVAHGQDADSLASSFFSGEPSSEIPRSPRH